MLLVAAGCRPEVPRVAGPESPLLTARLYGHMVWEVPRGGIQTVRLPDGDSAVLRPAAPDTATAFPTVHSLSGPDAEGRIAYVEDHFFTADEKDRRHCLKTVRIDGTEDTLVFQRPGSAMQAVGAAGHMAIGRHLALSRRGGQVLLLRDLVPVQMPGSLLGEGTLEVWDVASRASRDLGLRILDAPLAWLPDGRRFVAVSLVARQELPGDFHGLAELGEVERNWPRLPVVFLGELGSAAVVRLGLGSEAVVSPDGAVVWFGGSIGQLRSHWSRCELATGAVQPVELPGLAGRAFAAATNDLVLYQGWPTAGAEERWTTVGSRPGGTPLVTIKVADLGARTFATVVPWIDPRSSLSFGAR